MDKTINSVKNNFCDYKKLTPRSSQSGNSSVNASVSIQAPDRVCPPNKKDVF